MTNSEPPIHSSRPLKLATWQTSKLTLEEQQICQNFLDLFDDFFLLCTGKKGDASFVLTAGPAGYTKHVYFIYEDNQPIGLIDMIQDYPKAGTWTIGHFLIHPDKRSQGVGSQFIKDLHTTLKGTLRCVVQDVNPKALSFWTRLGFVKTKEIQEKKWVNFILERLNSLDKN